jgi:cytochrome d ubiquinol oxidase subunit I
MHLFSTWMVAIGSNLSALWILVANGWMQTPVGMAFNPDTARFEMQDLWAIISSPVAISHFAHATTSGFLLASLFVVGISSFYLLKKRHIEFAKRSIAVACIFGLFSAMFVAFTGDEHAYITAREQPMKLAAMEALYDGMTPSGLVAIGLMRPGVEPGGEDPFYFKIEIPGMLSLLANRNFRSFVPGINDLVFGNEEQNIVGVEEKMRRGRQAVASLADYKQAMKEGAYPAANSALERFNEDRDYLGYGYLESADQAVPPVWLIFYAFRVMVGLGTFFILFFVVYLYLLEKRQLEKRTLVLRIGVAAIFLGYIAQQAGWLVTEVGRQPWAIQGLLPVNIATSNLDSMTVAISFFLFLSIFTVLLIAAVRILTKQISIGPEGD